jgi:hypothetical protein
MKYLITTILVFGLFVSGANAANRVGSRSGSTGGSSSLSIGSSLSFNGAAGKVDLGANLLPDFWGHPGVSASLWIKPTATEYGRGLVNNTLGGGPSDVAYTFSLSDNGVAFLLWGNGTDYGSVETGAGAVVAGQWQNIVITTATTTGTTHIYVNGVDKVSGVAQVTRSLKDGSNWTLGQSLGLNTTPYVYSGLMDEVKIWNRELTPTEAIQPYYGSTPTGVSSSYSFNELSGSLAIDSVGGKNGTITTATYSTDIPRRGGGGGRVGNRVTNR